MERDEGIPEKPEYSIVLSGERNTRLNLSEKTSVAFSIIWLLMLLPAYFKLGSNPLLLTHILSSFTMLLFSYHIFSGKRKLSLEAGKLSLQKGYLPWNESIDVDPEKIEFAYIKRNSSPGSVWLRPELWINMKNKEKILLTRGNSSTDLEELNLMAESINSELGLSRKTHSSSKKRKRLRGKKSKSKKNKLYNNRKPIPAFASEWETKPTGSQVLIDQTFWIIARRWQYDWTKDVSEHFIKLTNNQDEILISVRYADEKLMVYKEVLIKKGLVTRSKKLNRSTLHERISFRNVHFERVSYRRGYSYEDHSKNAETIVEILYYDKNRDRSLRFFKELGGRISVYLGERMDTTY